MEDHEILDQFLEHRQNYVIDNINAVAGCGGIGVADVGSGGEILGVKYDEQLQSEEHDVGDDDELKYVKEVQQSEKQQTGGKDFGDYSSSNELAENEEATYKYEIGNGGAVGMMGDANEIASVVSAFASSNSNGQEMSHVEAQEMVLDAQSGELYSPRTQEYVQEQTEIGDDEEASSLATNGTSSLSENVAHPLVDDSEFSADDLIKAITEDGSISLGERGTGLNIDIEQTHWQLNPEAKEFVPNFGSNPASPTSPLPADFQPSNMDNVDFFGQTSMAVPRRIMVDDDDFVAQSPRKGRCGNMDAISLPAEQEFDKEADQRPHELAQDDVELLECVSTELGNKVSGDDSVVNDNIFQGKDDFIDNPTSNTIDHGPETSVDLEVDTSKTQHCDLSVTESDVMKQSIYVTSDEPIEDVLNSVQPIPTEIDSVNNSFIEDIVSNEFVGDKEQLQVEEKEHVSNSPSTEEMQVHLQSDLLSSTNDVSQNSFDINVDVASMQGSLYADPKQPIGDIQHQSLMADTTNPTEESEYLPIHSIDEVNPSKAEEELPVHDMDNSGIDEEHQLGVSSDMLLSSYTHEKHLMEETKESPRSASEVSGIEEQLSKISLNSDVHLSQTIEVAVAEIASDIGSTADCSIRPDDIGKECEQIITTQSCNVENVGEREGEHKVIQYESETLKTETDKENCNMQGDDIDHYHFDSSKIEKVNEIKMTEDNPCKDSSEIYSTARPENVEVCSHIAENPFDAKDSSEIFSTTSLEDVEVCNPFAENVLSENIVEDMLLEADNVPRVDESHYTIIDKESANIDGASLELSMQINTNELLDNIVHGDKEVTNDPQNTSATISPVQCFSLSASPELLEEPEINKSDILQTVNIPLEKSIDVAEMSIVDEPMNTHGESNVDEPLCKEIEDVSPVIDISDVAPSAEDILLINVNEVKNVSVLGNAVEDLQKDEQKSTETVGGEYPETNGSENVDTDKSKECPNHAEAEKENSVDEIKDKITDEDKITDNDVNLVPTVAVVPTQTNKIVPNSTEKKSDDIKKLVAKTASSAPKKHMGVAAKPKLAPPKTTSTTATEKKPNKPIGVPAKPKLVPPKPTTIVATDKKANKPIGIAAKPKLAPLKSTSTVATDKKINKPIGVSAKPKLAPSKPTNTPATDEKPNKPIGIAAKPKLVPPKPSSSTVTKPRPASAAASLTSKPTTLGVSGSNSANTAPRSKVTSPRAPLTSQIRKTAPGPAGAKSPVKPPTSNSLTKSSTTNVGSRTASSTTNVTTMTKPFTARPAPKSTSSVTTTSTTTRRSTVGGSTTTTTQITTSKAIASSATQRKSSPIKSVAGKTPTKSAISTSGAKTAKSVTKSTPPKSTSAEQTSKAHCSTVAELNGTTSPVLSTEEVQPVLLQQNSEPIVPNINEPLIVGLDVDSTEHMQIDLSSA